MSLGPKFSIHGEAKRVDQILRVLGKYGLGEWIAKVKPGLITKHVKGTDAERIAGMSREERIRNAITELGTTYIKLGQILSTRADLVGPEGRVVLADINDSMLQVGRDKLLDSGRLGNLEFVQADAQDLPFPDDSFDCISIAFGLRNVTDKDRALRSMLRVLKPGGRLLVLEFSKPGNDLLSKAYDTYSFRVLPLMGRLVANDGDSYQYLAESIRMHPDQDTLRDMMEDAGFTRCEYHNMTGGIVAVHRGVKA